MSVPLISYGAICSTGSDVPTAFAGIANGTDSLTPLAGMQTGLDKTVLCAQLTSEANEIIEHSPAPNRTGALALYAMEQALEEIGDLGEFRTGLVFATTVAGMPRSEQWYKDVVENPTSISRNRDALAYHEPASLAGYCAAQFGIQGVHTLSTACSTGLHAIGLAKRFVQRDVYDICIAVGSDALSVLTVRGFAGLLLLDPHGCRPFDARRAGISLGEGAAAVVLASENVLSSLPPPRAHVAGWGASADSHHMTAPHPQGSGANKAVRQALSEANLLPESIDLIAAHGTGTPDNDVAEIRAMRQVFDSLPPFYSNKRSVGHTLAASGILEAVFAVCALEGGEIPATGGFEQQDDSIGAAPSSGGKASVKHVLKNSFGFGGNNAALILSKQS